MIPKCKTAFATALCAAAFCQLGMAQALPSSVLQIDVENLVEYLDDVGDPSKFATDPNVTTARQPRNFAQTSYIGDIVAINGESAKGTFTRVTKRLALTPPPLTAGQAEADTTRNAAVADSFEIQKSDGGPVGTIAWSGLGQGDPPLGAPSSASSGTFVIVGGTGAFLGVRGQGGQGTFAQRVPVRIASITEDPGNRRRNGGGKVRFVLQVIPMFVPQIVVTGTGPAVFHSSDLTPVITAKPAQPGEVLITMATGMGPTRPGVDPGQPFPPYPANQLQLINSPVAATVNGQSAAIINAIGWPSLVDTYRVDVRVPEGITTGTARIQLSAAWMVGPSVNIPIQ